MKQKYDLFISYSHMDRQFVQYWLLPRLEDNGLSICVDYRDFEVGIPSLINMEQAIERSLRTIVVLTPNWVQSQWTEFESLLVGTSDPTGRRRKLIPLRLENCSVPSRINMLTYADFRDPLTRDMEFEKLLRQIQALPTEEERSVSRFMFDEAHGQKRWHIAPTTTLGYSEARRSLLKIGAVTSNKDGALSEATLSRCDVLILPMPFGMLVDKTEYDALVHWVSRGGRLLIFGFYFMEAHLYTNFSTLGKRLQIEFGRDLIMPRGRTSRDDALGQAYPVRWDLCAVFEPQASVPSHPILSEVRTVALQSSCTVRSCAQRVNCELELRTDNNVSVMSPLRGEYSDDVDGKFQIIYEYSIDDALPCTFLIAQSLDKGRIVAIGSWKMFVDDFMKDPRLDNMKLFQNTVSWLLEDPTESR